MNWSRLIPLVTASAWAVPALAQPCSPYWTLVGGMGGAQGRVVVFDDGSGPALYRGPIPQPGQCCPVVGRWNGRDWTLLLAGLPNSSSFGGFVVFDEGGGPRLHAGGYLYQTNLTPWVKRWNGTSWEDPTPGLFSAAQGIGAALSIDDGSGPVIYGVQCFPQSGCNGNQVIRWTGSGWVPVGGPVDVDGAIGLLAGLDLGNGPRLFAAGVFSSINGVPASCVAMWNGAQWEALGGGVSGLVRAICAYDDGRGPAVYVGGNFLQAGNASNVVNYIARWDGQSWSNVGGGVTSGIQINGLATFDDGRGTALYASGYFGQIGGVNARSIARWDGHTWEPLGNGFAGPAESFAVFDDGRGPSLFMAGDFGYAGGGTTSGFVQWVGCPNCYANCDNSTLSPRLNVLDFICFLNKFAARDPYANCTVDATIDVNDFLCFLNKFAAGCP